MDRNYFFDILDARIMNEDKREQMIAMAKLAKRCLNLKGKKRTTMKEVAMELRGNSNVPKSSTKLLRG